MSVIINPSTSGGGGGGVNGPGTSVVGDLALWANTSGTLLEDSPPAALTRVNDTNITITLGGTPATALVNATSITMGWTGTLAAGRLNSNVVQSVVNDTNVTGSISAQALTLGWTGFLGVTRGGTGTGTAFTQNSLVFAGASGVYSQDNNGIIWDESNKRFGIGNGTTLDVYLQRDAANILAQYNSTNAQTFRLYNTFTNSTNYERAIFDWQGTSNVLTIGTEKGSGGGSIRNLVLSYGGTVVADFTSAASDTGGASIAIGQGALASQVPSAAYNNVAIGKDALNSANTATAIRNIAIGTNALLDNASGPNNVAIGFNALLLNQSGGANFALGTQALESLTSGNNNIGIGTTAWDSLDASSNNVGIGISVGLSLTSGSNNTIIGPLAGSNITSGSANTIIGRWQGPSSTLSNVIAFADGSNPTNPFLDYNYTHANAWTFNAAFMVTPVAVASLPAAGIAGRRHFVTDATATTFASIVAGTGANKVPVYDDGTNWRIG